MKNKKIIVKIIIGIILLFLIHFIGTTIAINYYLKEYQFSSKELPKTIAVYYHMNKGFTRS